MPKITDNSQFISKKDYKDKIKAFCIQCMGGEQEQGVRTEIRNCTVSTCPLYEVRPYKTKCT